MIITKIGNKILEFECFHAECWKEHIEEAIRERGFGKDRKGEKRLV